MAGERDGTSTAVGRSEWRWVAGWTLALLLVTSLPYLLAWRTAAGTGMTFGGHLIGVEDGNTYLAKMGLGARGAWLFKISYTSEAHSGVLVYPFYLLLGKVATLWPGGPGTLPLRLIWTFHLARLVCAAGLLGVVYRVAAEFLASVTLRRLAWLMISLGGGFGWLLVSLGLDNWLGSTPLDFILPEGFTFLTVLALPHIALGRALFLAGMLAWLDDRGWRAGLWWLLAGLVVPFFPVIAGVVVGATCLAWWALRKRFPRQALLRSIRSGVVVAPLVGYTGWVFLGHPVMRGWAAQNLALSPPVGHYLAAYLLPGLLALAGAAWVWHKRPDERLWLLVAWLVVVPLLVYLPFNLQRRLVEGYQVPLYLLAVVGGWRVVWPLLRGRLTRPRLLMAGFLLLLCPTSLMLLAGSSSAALGGSGPIFHPRGEVAIADWLGEHVEPQAIVLATYQTGNFLPAWAPVRSYYGHGPETIDFSAKGELVTRFYGQAENDSRWRHDFVVDNRIAYVVAAPDELSAGQAADWLELSYACDGWRLFKVDSDG